MMYTIEDLVKLRRAVNRDKFRELSKMCRSKDHKKKELFQKEIKSLIKEIETKTGQAVK